MSGSSSAGNGGWFSNGGDATTGNTGNTNGGDVSNDGNGILDGAGSSTFSFTLQASMSRFLRYSFQIKLAMQVLQRAETLMLAVHKCFRFIHLALAHT